MNTNNESNTMKKTFKPIHLELFHDELGFKNHFGINLVIRTRGALREIVKWLRGEGFVAMSIIERGDVSEVSISRHIEYFEYMPLSATLLTRLMGYAA